MNATFAAEPSTILAAVIGLGTSAAAEQNKGKGRPKTAAVGRGTADAARPVWRLGRLYGTPEGKKVCFALAKPKSSTTKPAGRKRDPAYVFISSRPAEKCATRFRSSRLSVPANSDATAEIGPTRFAMYTQNDGAWIKNVAEEARLIDAMRKGAELTIKGTSTRNARSRPTVFAQGVEPRRWIASSRSASPSVEADFGFGTLAGLCFIARRPIYGLMTAVHSSPSRREGAA